MGNRGSEPTGCGDFEVVVDHGDFEVVVDHGDFEYVSDHCDNESKLDERYCFGIGVSGGLDIANSASRLRKFRC